MIPIELARKLGSGELSLDSTAAKGELELDELSNLAAAESADVRAGVAMLLSRAQPSSDMERLLAALLEDAEPRVLACTLWAMEEKPELAKSCFALIVRTLEKPHWEVRLPAVTVLGKVACQDSLFDSVDWAAILEQTISDDCEAIRAEAAVLLGCCQLPQTTFEPLLHQLFADDSFDVRRAALNAAIRCSPPFESVAAIIESGLRDASHDVRIGACRLARRYPRAKVQFAEVLKELGGSSDAELRAAADEALAEI